MPIFHGELQLRTAFGAIDWHVHECCTLSAGGGDRIVCSRDPKLDRTSADPGTTLLVLVVLWLAGRVAVTLSA